jgi:S-formylglutathione hydrolase
MRITHYNGGKLMGRSQGVAARPWRVRVVLASVAAAVAMGTASVVPAAPSPSKAGATIVEGTLASERVPSPVEYLVLLPPGYDADDAQYPLLLWLHGGGGSREFLRRQQALFEQAWAEHGVQPMVVATPSAGRSFYLDYHDGSERWETFLLEEFLPALASRYRVAGTSRYIGGISMGGMGSLRIAFKHPDRVLAVIALEPGIEPALAWADVGLEDKFWRSDELLEARYGRPVDTHWAANNPATIAHADPERLKNSGLAIYIEVGSEDAFGLDRGTEFLHRVLFDAGVRHEYRYVLGADHVGRTMGPRVLDALGFLRRIETPAEPDPEVIRLRRGITTMKRQVGLPVDADE